MKKALIDPHFVSNVAPHDTEGINPFNSVKWKVTTAEIKDTDGKTIFKQENVRFPASWSQNAINIVAQKYFRGHIGDSDREHDLETMIRRVAQTIGPWGRDAGYFSTDEEQKTFQNELCYILLHQMASFNSPVWFNIGWKSNPQASACFINSVEDSMESILNLVVKEGMLFKGGSGAGSNLSILRGSEEPLMGGGTSSGPLSFMRGYDSFAGAIKSGGSTRRAAKMVILDVDHPDILDFITSKAKEEKKAHALIEAGYDGNFNVSGGAYDTVAYQNANHSVRVTDEFMEAVRDDKEWHTINRVDKVQAAKYPARDIMKAMAKATWECGDPGIQFDTIINEWNTCSKTDRIHASNPCSEYMFLDDTACNLSSINLMSLLDLGEFDHGFAINDFKQIIKVMITAMDIIVGSASYPTPIIRENSHKYRTLGLGYTNLGSLLITMGLRYGSAESRTLTGTITSLLTAEAYKMSAAIAERMGFFPGYPENADPVFEVIHKHASANADLIYKIELIPQDRPGKEMALSLFKESSLAWDIVQEATDPAECHENDCPVGIRNAQVTVLAPTGTISFMMDCETTGIEPQLALIKYKKLIGGGTMKIVAKDIEGALHNLDYTQETIDQILSDVYKTGSIPEGLVRSNHISIFDCSFPDPRTGRCIHWSDHLEMMAAAQPFISGAISKTINMPNNATIDDIMESYMIAWRLGLKAIAVYRDGCKMTQPLTTKEDKGSKKPNGSPPKTLRHKLPDTRPSRTHKFSVGGHDGYITAGFYKNGKLGEVFIIMSKEGSSVRGLMDAFATSISIGLQHGVPLEHFSNKFSGMRFEPSGFTKNQEMPTASSVVDYVLRWLLSVQKEFLDKGAKDTDILAPISDNKDTEIPTLVLAGNMDGPPCVECGSIMAMVGRCHVCSHCGANAGACE